MASQGSNSPSSTINDTSLGTIAWVNPNNVRNSDDIYAVSTMSGVVTANFLKTTNFGFSIPLGATITGIAVDIEAKIDIGTWTIDYVRLVKNNTIGSTNQNIGVYNQTDKYNTAGSSTDLWGETWTPADINSSQFGVAISHFNNDSNTYIISVDHIRVTIYYTIPPFQGPLSPSQVSDNDSIGSAIWDFPERAKTQNSQFATATMVLNGTTHYLVATNFGFAIPAGATVNGIIVEILRQEDDLLDNIFDNALRIVKTGNIGLTDKSSSTEWNINETSYISYGSSTDLWGETWSTGNINNSGFGVALSAKSTLGLALNNAEVDHIRITVFYIAGQTTTSTSTSTSSSTSTTSTSSSTSSSTTTSTSTSTSTTATSSSTSTSTSSSSSTSISTSTSTSSSTSSSTSTTSTSISTSTTSTSSSTTSTSSSTTSTSSSTTSTSTSTTTTFAYPAEFKVSATKQA